MPLDCKEKLNPNRVTRDGVHQGNRLAESLKPSYVKVDEHNPEDWMVFAARYASYVKYFDQTNTHVGNWVPFFNGSPAAIIAIAATEEVNVNRNKLYEYFSYILDLSNENQNIKLRHAFGNLLSCTATLAWQIERMHQLLPDTIELKGILKNLISSQLAPGFTRLIAYYKFATSHKDTITGLPDYDFTPLPDWGILGAEVPPFPGILLNNFSTQWTDGITSWQNHLAAIAEDGSVFGDPWPNTVFERLNHAVGHNLFKSIFDQFLKSYARLNAEAKRNIKLLFEHQDDHPPHYTLFLSFLQLMVHARDHANEFTGRHLDFYYKDVLQLKTRKPEPNEVHVIIELAKHVDDHLLNKGTLFKAGKDSTGKDVVYETIEDFIPNKATVAALMSLFRYDRKGSDLILPIHDERFYASPIANSSDGLGAELTTIDQQWHPFANKEYKDDRLHKIEMPKADIGFAVASHYLWLREGTRTVSLIINNELHEKSNEGLSNQSGLNILKPGFDSIALKDLFTIELSGEKGWVPAAIHYARHLGNDLTIRFVLDGQQPAIVPYSLKIHGPGFEPGLPVARLRLLNHDSQKYGYPILKDIQVNSVQISIHVSGIKNLALSNDFGTVDPSKPFQPFGAIPKSGAKFIIGNNELFQKGKGVTVTSLNINWEIIGESQVGRSFLNKGNWSDSKEIAFSSTNQILVSDHNLHDVPIEFAEDESYNPKSKSGFFGFTLFNDLNYGEFQTNIIKYVGVKLSPQTTDDDSITLKLPFIPNILSIALNYSASQTFNLTEGQNQFEKREGRFYHLHPFGYSEEHRVINEKITPSLLPLFTSSSLNTAEDECAPEIKSNKVEPHLSSGALEVAGIKLSQLDSISDKLVATGVPVEHEAEFYIGIADLNPPQNLSLLFQLAEGSANPKTTNRITILYGVT